MSYINPTSDSDLRDKVIPIIAASRRSDASSLGNLNLDEATIKIVALIRNEIIKAESQRITSIWEDIKIATWSKDDAGTLSRIINKNYDQLRSIKQ